VSSEFVRGGTTPPIIGQQPRGLLEQIQIEGQRPPPSIGNAIMGVIRYEAVRSLTLVRILIWIALVGFPVALVTAALQIVEEEFTASNESLDSLTFLMFILLPQTVTVLSMLLFAAPIVNSELESQAWIYAIVRPRARKAILLGKYVVAVLWCGSCTSVATLLIVAIAKYFTIPHAEDLIGIQLGLCWLAALCYGALLLAIGTFFQRRAMVYAFAYSIGVEALMGWIPAVVNLFTVSYRLRSLLFSWIGSHKTIKLDDLPFQWEDHPIKQLSVLALMVAGLLALSIWRIDRNQYRWQSEV
jgi:ABC-type transport system involved in multi-copper enzyme maturation permease subunit